MATGMHSANCGSVMTGITTHMSTSFRPYSATITTVRPSTNIRFASAPPSLWFDAPSVTYAHADAATPVHPNNAHSPYGLPAVRVGDPTSDRGAGAPQGFHRLCGIVVPRG